MMRLLRASVLISTLSLLLFLGANIPDAYAVHNTNGPATIDIRQHYDRLAGYRNTCMEDKTEISVPAIPPAPPGKVEICAVPAPATSTGGIVTSCRKEVISFNGDWYCTFVAPDHSKIIADPNILRGSETRLYNSNGELVDFTNTGGFGDDRDGGGELADTESVAAASEPGKCELGNLPQCFLNLPGYLLSAIGYAILVLSTFILFLAGTVFNWVVIRTVFQFATYFGTSEGMLVAWTVLRDIANIALLFGFVFIGVATILNTQSVEGYSAKKALPRLIIFAVLLNFSLFATQGIIDVANGFASIFSTYAGQECGQADEATGTEGQQNEDCANVGISGKIMSAAGMNHMFSTDGMSGAWEKPYSTAAMLIILSILVSITAMVLFAASIMLVIRVVVLSLLMVTSPIGFAGLAIPSLNKIAQDWWHRLINQAFFAPLYLLMVFISLKLVDGLQTGGASLPQALTADVSSGGTIAGNMQVVVVYAIVIGFMVGSLMVAQKMGAAGAGFATKTAGGLAFGAQGMVMRHSVGRLSAAASNSMRSGRFAALGETRVGRRLLMATDYGSKASFSSRNALGSVMKATGTGVDVGSASKKVSHGYHGVEEQEEKDRLAHAKSISGARLEGSSERAARMAREQTDIDERRVAAADGATDELTRNEAEAMNVTVDALAAEAAATAAQTAAQMNQANQQNDVNALRLQVAQNPADAVLQAQLTQAELTLVQDTTQLAQADEALTQATNAVAAARTTEAASTTARTERDTALAAEIPDGERAVISETERQLRYADNVETAHGQGFRFGNSRNTGTTPLTTLRRDPVTGRIIGQGTQYRRSGHMAESASRAIRNYAGQTPEQRQIAAMAAALQQRNAAPPAAPAGGGGAAAPAGGGH